MKRLFILLALSTVECSRILVVFPMSSYSHNSLGFRLAKELADRGHIVTMITPYEQKKPIQNFRDVPVEAVVPYMEERKKRLFDVGRMNFMDSTMMIYEMGHKIDELVFADKNVQKFLTTEETFDVVIAENFVNDASAAFAYHFKAPLIFLSPMPASTFNNYLFANPAPPSYIPTALSSLRPVMNFWDRTKNLFLRITSEIIREFVFLPKQRQLVKKYFGEEVELDEILYNTSLMLTNSHVSTNAAIPHVPNIIEIGGFHINPAKEIPKDLQKFLDEAKEGVVLFSMGSNLKSKDLRPEVRKALLAAFSKIKEKVLWKFETDLPDLPANVKIMSWIPQQNVLGHENVKVFISHGGLLSTIEAVYFGVPIIGIPVFGDQKTNVARAMDNGYGLSVPLAEISEEKLSWALNEIINNPRYRENVKKRSAAMHDQPLKPMDSAIYWIEYVIRHKGAPFHRSAGLLLRWYQREMVDILVFLSVIVVISLAIFYKIVKTVTGFLRKPKSKKTAVSKNKKKNN